MSDNNPKHPPVSGKRLQQAHKEMSAPGFLDKLTGYVHYHCRKAGLFQGPGMIGGDDPEGLTTNIIIAVLEGNRQWKTNLSFTDACRSAAKSIVSNYKDKAATKLSWNLVSSGTEEWSDDPSETAYPEADCPLPDDLLIAKEAKDLKDAKLLQLSDQVAKGSLEEKILEGLLFPSGDWGRKQVRQKHNCTDSELTSAIVRIRKLAQKLEL